MRKLATALLTGCLAISMTNGALAASNNTVFQLDNDKFKVNNQEFSMDATPFISNDRVYVPIRYLAKALGVQDKDISWDETTQTANLILHDESTIGVKVRVGDQSLLVNNSADGSVNQAEYISNSTVKMDVAPLEKNGRVFLPARWIAEAFGYVAKWDETTKCVLIYPVGENNQEPSNLVPSASFQEIKFSNDYLNVDMKVPIVAGLKDASFQENINQQVMQKALQVKEEMERGANEYKQLVESQDLPLRPYQLVVDYNTVITKQVLSLMVQTYEFTGGAHGGAWKDYYNVNIKDSKIITLQGLFKEGLDYKKIINEEIKRQIEESNRNGAGIFYEGDTGFKSIDDNQAFYIDGDNLVICFSQYEIAPYAGGMPEFRIPLSLLKGNLDDEFLNLIIN